jgi:DNA-binding NarL/FixJ family response regulator
LTLSISVEQNDPSCERPSIVIVDCHPLWRSCLARILRSEIQDFTILEIETAHHLDSVVGKHIGLVALNIGSSAMTDECVLNSLSYLRRSLPEAPFMLLTRLEESTISDAMISEVTRFGVRGYITDSASVEIALAALRLVIAGGVYFPRSLIMDCANWVPVSSENIVALQPAITIDGIATEVPAITNKSNIAFTERERQVLATLLRGMSNKVIANELNLSQNTVKSHISRIMQKLHAKNRTEAVVLSQHSAQVTNGGSQSGISDV